MIPLIYLIKENRVTRDYLVHYFDSNDEPQAVNVRIDTRWCNKNCIPYKQAVIKHIEAKVGGFKRLAFEHDEVGAK